MGSKSLILFVLLLVSSAYGGCPDGTIYGNQFNKCYYFFPAAEIFLEAELACQSMGGDLVTISSAFENTYVSGIVGAQSSTTSFWTGLNLLMAKDWSWIDGDLYPYRNWAPGLPADPSAYQCGAVRMNDSMWQKELCSSYRPYMCQISPNRPTDRPINCGTTTTPVPYTPPPGEACPGGHCPDSTYTLNPETCKCYKYYDDEGTNYQGSAQFCLNENATLPVILDSVDNAFLSNFTQQQSSLESNPWIGLWCLTDQVSSCKWGDGSPLGYTNFAWNYPEADKPVYLDEIDGQWYSFVPWAKGSFICQQAGIRPSEEPQLAKRRHSHKFKRLGV